MTPTRLVVIASLLAGLTTACQRQPTPAVEPDRAAPATTNTTPAPSAEPVTPPATPAPPAAAAAIATQPGPDGSQWELTKASVSGDLLTVQFNARAATDKPLSAMVNVDQIGVIDTATSQRYSVVKDGDGNAMISTPFPTDKKILYVNVGKAETATVWFKVPAPPATSTTVSITVPEVGAFDGVAIQR